ncbi:hypothetical protein AKN87_07110 [Thiopseudomonas alkaliphila]|uniref:type II toxin-antitoxin system RelB/DinJ family antitoxin n=1 Tax=Thiopseudomonas alkaliphila TaxID=1697053 RepID=UPI00069E7491|nr:type II toxin-antitoxin system RelB/DinJ family antitoxin [Thiopseudomonas alkaliphila]AKX44890.1 hypothetical protein AKN87_07110 [Thiopseudomonas alkaliphila]AKX51378.1 hypothetical protein AKN92_07655 [Thiopseudomonas alkaliphila]
MLTAMNTDVRSRVSADLKQEAAEVLQGCGLNVSSAIRLFLEQVVQEQKLPFEVKRHPSAKMKIALQEAKAIEAMFSNMET